MCDALGTGETKKTQAYLKEFVEGDFLLERVKLLTAPAPRIRALTLLLIPFPADTPEKAMEEGQPTCDTDPRVRNPALAWSSSGYWGLLWSESAGGRLLSLSFSLSLSLPLK